ncbi:MAG: 2-C-methyl-D-erythritol 2,4-cyclodiphosphate synthase [Bacilli bacterium]|jgi:2-C-methyl-D-erythritol 2,4-cyclodiphosphate synthase
MYRIGMSRDIHRLIKGRPLWIGGVLIDHDFGFEAHSDGDIVLHALTEALLGSLALGDLGTHFPNTDPQYKDKPSSYFVQYAKRLVEAKGYRVCNIDISIVIESPRLSPHIPTMVARIGKMIGLASDQISVKAGTNEGLGYIGQGLGAEATCVVLVEKIIDQAH